MRKSIVVWGWLLAGVGFSWSAMAAENDAAAAATGEAVQDTDTGAEAAGSEQGASHEEPETQPQEAAQCLPACRAGFVCVQGACVSACTPPCSPGFQCTSDARCVSVPGQSQATGPSSHVDLQSAVIIQRQVEARQRRLAIKKARQEAMQRSRIVLTWDWHMMSLSDFFRSYVALGVGFRKNFSSIVGMRVRAGGGAGLLKPSEFATSSLYEPDPANRVMGAAWLDAAMLLGPLGNFFVGPEWWATYCFTKDTVFRDAEDSSSSSYGSSHEETLSSHSGMLAGVGLAMAVLTGDKMNAGLEWGPRITLVDTTGSEQMVGFSVYLGGTFQILVQ